MLSRNDIRALAAVAAWASLWFVIGWVVTRLGDASAVESDGVVFAWRMGLFIGAVVGAFGSTEPRGSRAQNTFTVGAILIASAMPMYLPGQTDRAQWAFNLAAIGAGAIIAFPAARLAAASIRRARASKTEGGSRD